MDEYIELISIFTKDDFVMDYESVAKKEYTKEKKDFEEKWSRSFKVDKYKSLLYLGFHSKVDYMSPSVHFLYLISDMFIQKIAQQPDMEILRESLEIEISLEEIELVMNKVPFVNGMEYVNADWIHGAWDRLQNVYRHEISIYQGSVSQFLTEHNSGINVAGRVFFHLVENNSGEYPFAFLATYSRK